MLQRKRKTTDDLTIIKKDIQAIKRKLATSATKDDLKRFATKDDLKRFATKDDLKRFATKDDLKRFATKDDLKSLGAETKKGFAEVMWELKTISEENIVLSDMKRQVNEHEDRLEIVESKLRIAT